MAGPGYSHHFQIDQGHRRRSRTVPGSSPIAGFGRLGGQRAVVEPRALDFETDAVTRLRTQCRASAAAAPEARASALPSVDQYAQRARSRVAPNPKSRAAARAPANAIFAPIIGQ